MKVKLEEMTLKEVRDNAPFEVAVLPWGACESHNLHLPCGCDALTVGKIAEISARKAKEQGARAVVLPTIPIGVDYNQMEFPLTLNLAPTTQLAILQDVIRALEKHKVLKFVLMNGHGGNNFKALVRQVQDTTDIRMFLLDWWKLSEETANRVCEDHGGEHGNEEETSWMMYLHPALVNLTWADAGRVKEPRLKALAKGEVWTPRPWHLLTSNAGHGNPAKATAEKGRAMVDAATDRIASFLKELSEAEIDEKFPY